MFALETHDLVIGVLTLLVITPTVAVIEAFAEPALVRPTATFARHYVGVHNFFQNYIYRAIFYVLLAILVI